MFLEQGVGFLKAGEKDAGKIAGFCGQPDGTLDDGEDMTTLAISQCLR